nr:hypothetical protein [uncultured Acinetobacter sp.]
MASVQIRIQDKLADEIETAKWEIKYKLRLEIQNVDILNALIYHHLKDLTEEEVLQYRKKFLGKDENNEEIDHRCIVSNNMHLCPC